jgi:hypothetical protein
MTSSHTDIPDAPPPDVLLAVDAAWERAARFAAAGLDLDLSVGRVGGRFRGRLLRDDGVALVLSARQVLAIACGDAMPPLPPRAG